MKFVANKTLVEVIKEGDLVVLILETFILILMESGTENREKNLIS